MLMTTKVLTGVFCGLALVTQLSAQEVSIGRSETPKSKADAAAIKEALDELRPQKAIAVQPAKPASSEAKPAAAKPATTAQVTPPKKPVTAPESKPAPNKPAAPAQVAVQKPAPPAHGPSIEIGSERVNLSSPSETKLPKADASRTVQAPVVTKPSVPESAPATPARKPATPAVASSAPAKVPATKPAPAVPNKPPTALAVGTAPARLNHEPEKMPDAPANFSGATAFTRLAGGFDFPIGKPDAQGYYKARGFQSHGHLGEDWDGTGGGDTDMGDPIFCIADGVVVFARDCHQGWGNVIIVRHAYREGGSVRNIDSFYAHCQKILVKKGQSVSRGQQIAAIGNAHGLYDAHLHFEIRKNLAIGMSRDKFAKDQSNYCDPTQFIAAHRHLQNSAGNWRIAMNTFTYDEKIKWDKLRNYAHARTGGGSGQSAKNLKKALAAQNVSARSN